MRTTTYNIPMTFEELGKGQQVGVDVELKFDFEPGEKRVMYTSNGDGYPGSPPHMEYVGCNVTKVWGGDHNDPWEFDRCSRPDWFTALDRMVDDYIWKNVREIEERAMDDLAERFEQYD